MNRRTTRRIISRSRRFNSECLVVSASRPHPGRVLAMLRGETLARPQPQGEGTAFARRSLDRESRSRSPQTSISMEV